MYEYVEKQISPRNSYANQELDCFLKEQGITRDGNLEYTMGIYSGDKLIATGSVFKNSLRCLAVSSAYQGEGILNQVVTHLVNYQAQRGIYHLFLYTKCDKAAFFSGLGFYEIARADGLAVFMENRKNGFNDYLKTLEEESPKTEGSQVAIVMNANPFTLGHQHLIEQASQNNAQVHLFAVSEDVSLVPFSVRWDLMKQGISHLSNVVLHQTDSYMISSATFPSYFIVDSQDVMKAQARLDIAVFSKIAEQLGITKRYVGEEPFSKVTDIYNQVMKEELGKQGISCITIPRTSHDNMAISASQVRMLIHNGDLLKIAPLVPPSTFAYFLSSEAKPVIDAIQATDQIIHH